MLIYKNIHFLHRQVEADYQQLEKITKRLY